MNILILFIIRINQYHKKPRFLAQVKRDTNIKIKEINLYFKFQLEMSA